MQVCPSVCIGLHEELYGTHTARFFKGKVKSAPHTHGTDCNRTRPTGRMPTVYAALEGGGTTFVVAIAHDDPTNIVERAEFKTTSPAETIGKCCGAWPPARPLPHTRPPPPCDGRAPARASSRPRVRRRTADPRRASSLPSAAWLKTRRYDALGVATFGPVDLDPASPTYGYITTTPKPGWKHTDVLGPLRAVDPSAPILFDTDVNAPQRGQTRRPGSGRAAPSTARSALPLAHSGPLGPRAGLRPRDSRRAALVPDRGASEGTGFHCVWLPRRPHSPSSSRCHLASSKSRYRPSARGRHARWPLRAKRACAGGHLQPCSPAVSGL